MSSLNNTILDYLASMHYPTDIETLQVFSNREREHFKHILKRMSYLYDKITKQRGYSTPNRWSLDKDEFRALEWVLWEMGLIFSEEPIKIEFEPFGMKQVEVINQ